MPRNCCVSYCKNYYQHGEGKIFHSFPKDPIVINEWKRRLKIDEPSKSKHQFVCSDHFRKSDYNISNRGKKFLLEKGSLPMEKVLKSKTVLRFAKDDESKNRRVPFRPLNTTEVDESESFRILNESISSLTWKTVLDDKTGNLELTPEISSNELTSTNTLDSENNFMVNCDEDSSDRSANREKAFLTISSTTLDDDNVANRDDFFTTGKIVLNDKTGNFILNTLDPENNFMINCDEDSSEAWVEKLLQSDYVKSDFHVKGSQTSTNSLDSQNNFIINSKCGSEQLINSDYLTKKNTVDKSVTVKPDVQDKGIQTSLPRKRTSYSCLSDENLKYFTGLERDNLGVVTCISFNEFGNEIFGGRNGNIIVWDHTNHSVLRSLDHTDDICALSAHPKLPQFVTDGGLDRFLQLYDTVKHSVLWSENIGEQIYACAFSNDGERIAVGTAKGKLILLDKNGRQIYSQNIDSYEQIRVTHMDWSNDNKKLRVSSENHNLFYLNVERYEQISDLSTITEVKWASESCVEEVGTFANKIVTRRGKLVVSADDSGNIQLHSYHSYPISGSKSLNTYCHTSRVTALQFTKNNGIISANEKTIMELVIV